MRKTYTIKVIEEKTGDAGCYNVGIEDKTESSQDREPFRWCCIANKIAILLLIAGLLVLSFIVFKSILDANESIVCKETTVQKFQKSKCSLFFFFPKTCEKICGVTNQTTSKNVNIYIILAGAYFLTLVVTIAFLLVLFIKDDSCLKFAKLNELHSIKCKILNEVFNPEYDEKEETVESKNPSNGSKECCKENETSIKNKTSNQAALLKHYMTCITEL